MEHLLSQSARPLLECLARHRTLCGFDFDGTLSPIVDHPGDAGMRERTRLLLVALASCYPCVVISGRSRKDLLGRLGGLKAVRAIGNHGAETGSLTRASRRRVGRWKKILDREVAEIPGLWVEDKGLSLAVHYRHASGKREVRRRILAVSRGLPQVRVFGGKQVINLVWDQAPHKGDALAAERDRLGCDWVFYAGDDANDEDAFALDGNLVAVRIGLKQGSRACYYLRGQAEVDRLLALLVDLRRKQSPLPDGARRKMPQLRTIEVGG